MQMNGKISDVVNIDVSLEITMTVAEWESLLADANKPQEVNGPMWAFRTDLRALLAKVKSKESVPMTPRA